MKDDFEVKIIGEPAVQDLTQSEFDALCRTLYFEILELMNEES